jgi:hypothetical protein
VNQTKSNQIKPGQSISSAEAEVDVVLMAAVIEDSELGRFEATILD